MRQSRRSATYEYPCRRQPLTCCLLPKAHLCEAAAMRSEINRARLSPALIPSLKGRLTQGWEESIERKRRPSLSRSISGKPWFLPQALIDLTSIHLWDWRTVKEQNSRKGTCYFPNFAWGEGKKSLFPPSHQQISSSFPSFNHPCQDAPEKAIFSNFPLIQQGHVSPSLLFSSPSRLLYIWEMHTRTLQEKQERRGTKKSPARQREVWGKLNSKLPLSCAHLYYCSM